MWWGVVAWGLRTIEFASLSMHPSTPPPIPVLLGFRRLANLWLLLRPALALGLLGWCILRIREVVAVVVVAVHRW